MRTGDYKINYYNRYGKRLKDFDDYAESIQDAKRKAFLLIESCNINDEHSSPVSYSIDRRVFNSLDG